MNEKSIIKFQSLFRNYISKLKLNNLIIKIQSVVRKFLCKLRLNKLNDNFTLDIVNKLLDNYIDKINLNKEINKKLDKRKIRNDNFPCAISENIVKYAFSKKYNIMPSWNTKKGDLELLDNKILEVKAFSSIGPTSFGPNEMWYRLYIIDCTKFIEKKFKIYEINLSNNDSKFQNIKVNKNETFYSQSKNKRRPRISFNDLQKQLSENMKVIFDDSLEKLY